MANFRTLSPLTGSLVSDRGDVNLPKLPGMTFRDPRATAQKKNQGLRYIDGQAIVENNDEMVARRTAQVRVTSPGVTIARTALAATAGGLAIKGGARDPVPVWVKNDRQVLRYYCYFKESVTDRREENFRVRKCTIYYYLEDGSIHIGEPKQDNSGISQGTFLKRHVIQKDGGGEVGIEDLLVGSEITLYGRVFHITACDSFTRRFLECAGLPAPEDEGFPDEPITAYKNTLKKITIVHHKDFKTRQFLEKDGKVLRFFCVWDDRGSVYGERRPYILHYYLADDTIEIQEVKDRNSGRDPFPLLLRRGKLPRDVPQATLGRDAAAEDASKFYHESDLRIGSYIRVFNRDMLLHDCDDFTRNYYQTKWGMPAEYLEPVDVQEPMLAVPQNMIPPHNGIGSELDSLQNCIALIPKAQTKDFQKLMTNDGKVLCFSAKMIPDGTHVVSDVDRERDFVINYFLVDDSMSIYESPKRKAGLTGGRFLARGPAPKKPGTNKPYQPEDFYVGAQLHVYSRLFVLSAADEWTYKFMEAHPEQYAKSDFNSVMDHLADIVGQVQSRADVEKLKGAFIEQDKAGAGCLTPDDMAAAFARGGVDVNKQEVVTISRRLENSAKKVPIETLFRSLGI
ncbi:hypothetical protein KFL_000070310 [Klebsormidium nitens]|uniref:EF-hand domain-containing protein n=1 Tax=Klebsormidium nitens TaxID=105231 RepID=A0A1Y1HM45_KLENI|nr:hypothetical protein KFL_000070310 [Klebsormidium nitens]|eukprot:GAQ78061.1 hypothetical protein KFL_000070310 [Klebsormidium nitens]